MQAKAIVLDANILIRAVLGQRVRSLIFKYASTVTFFAPDVAYADAYKYLPGLLAKRGVDPALTLDLLARLERVVQPLHVESYVDLRELAWARIAIRDADDWPILACALLLDCPVWTEDTDFFGTGVAIWTSDRVELYLDSTRQA